MKRAVGGLIAIAIVIALALALGARHHHHPSPWPTATATATATSVPIVVPTAPPAASQIAGCQARGPLPDPICTPGAFNPAVTQATIQQTICVSGYSASYRAVSTAERKAAFAAYGLAYPQASGAYEGDHLVAIEDGGSNDLANLWPEAANPAPGFHQKDLEENRLHAKICSGAITLAEAQHELATNWLAAYHRDVGNASP